MTPQPQQDRLTECHCFTDDEYPYCNDRAMPCRYKDQFSRRKCPDYKSVIHHQVECDVRQGTLFAQQMVSDALGEPIYPRPHTSSTEAPDCFNDVSGDNTCEHATEGECGETKPICTIMGKCCRQEIVDRRPTYYQTFCNSSARDTAIRNETLEKIFPKASDEESKLGWRYDYKTIQRIADESQELDCEEGASMETVDLILTVLEESLRSTKEQP